MRVLKVSGHGSHLRFLFFDGTKHTISMSEWRGGMKTIYYEHHKVLLVRMGEGNSIIFSQSL